MSKYLNPKVDLTFKKVFGQHENLVKSLLNALLPLPAGRFIKEVSYLTPEQIPENPAKKYSIVDVKCKDNENRIFIVEMQTYWNNAYFVRTLHNTAKVYSSQLEKSQDFKDLKSVYALSIVDDNAFSKFKDTDEYIQEYYVINKNHPKDIHDDLALIFVELPKYKPVDKGQRAIKDLWMKYFTEIDERTQEADDDLLENPEIAEALDIVKRSAYTDAELASYEKSRLDEITERSAMSQSREEGKAEGIAEERAKAHEEKIEMARKMKSMQIPIDQILSITGLSADEI